MVGRELTIYQHPLYHITTIAHTTITSAYHNQYHVITIPHYKQTILLTNHQHHISLLPYLTITYIAPFHIANMSDYHRIASHHTPYQHHTITTSTIRYCISLLCDTINIYHTIPNVYREHMADHISERNCLTVLPIIRKSLGRG